MSAKAAMQINVLEYLENGGAKRFRDCTAIVDQGRSYTFVELEALREAVVSLGCARSCRNASWALPGRYLPASVRYPEDWLPPKLAADSPVLKKLNERETGYRTKCSSLSRCRRSRGIEALAVNGRSPQIRLRWLLLRPSRRRSARGSRHPIQASRFMPENLVCATIRRARDQASGRRSGSARYEESG